MLVEPLARPLPQPYIQLRKNTLGTGGAHLFRPRQGLTKMSLPAPLTGLHGWNPWTQAMLSADDEGNPWKGEGVGWNAYSGRVGQLYLNSGTDVYFRTLVGYFQCSRLSITENFTQSGWALDKVNHKYSYEFFLDNDLEETAPLVLYDDDEAFWTVSMWGAGAKGWVVLEDAVNQIKGTSCVGATLGAGANEDMFIYHTFANADWSAYEFLCLYVKGTNSGHNIELEVATVATDGAHDWRPRWVDNWVGWKRLVFSLRDSTWNLADPPDWTDVVRLLIVDISDYDWLVDFRIDRIVLDVGQWAKVEAYVPDALGAGLPSIHLHSWDGAAYEENQNRWDWTPLTTGWAFPDEYMPTGLRFLDNSSSDTIYGVAQGFTCYPIGEKTNVKAAKFGVAGDITYSAYYGCKKRIGFAIKLPPDDGQDSAIAGISQCRLKLEVYYGDADGLGLKYGQTTYEFENSNNAYYGLTNINDAWLALFDTTLGEAEYLIFGEKPTALTVRADENELIDRVEILTGGKLYAGSLHHSNMTVDSDGDGVPDFLEEVYDPSLVLDLPMDSIVGGKVLDQTANHNNGTLVGPLHLPTLVAGKYGNGILLDGTEDVITILDDASLDVTQFSILEWIKVPATAAEMILVDKLLDGENNGFRFRIEAASSVISIWRGNAGGGLALLGLTAVDDNGWHLVGVTYDGTNTVLYLDGIVDRTAAQASFDTTNAHELAIGAKTTLHTNLLLGTADDVRIYNRGLPAAEVRQIYDSGRRGHAESIPSLSKGVAIIT